MLIKHSKLRSRKMGYNTLRIYKCCAQYTYTKFYSARKHTFPVQPNKSHCLAIFGKLLNVDGFVVCVRADKYIQYCWARTTRTNII